MAGTVHCRFALTARCSSVWRQALNSFLDIAQEHCEKVGSISAVEPTAFPLEFYCEKQSGADETDDLSKVAALAVKPDLMSADGLVDRFGSQYVSPPISKSLGALMVQTFSTSGRASR
jgi:hypothetical protein